MRMQNSHKRAKSSSSIEEIPLWLSPKSLSRVVSPEPCSDNQHGIMTSDHISVKWPLPIMFGAEEYSFSLIDIPDKRYAEEAAVISRKLIRLLYDFQIIEFEWRKTYKKFIEAEKRKANLTPGVLQKSIDKAEADVISTREQLLRLQDQRDLFHSILDKIWMRCTQIKASISKELDLESLRKELSESVKARLPISDIFWTTKFKVKLNPAKSSQKHR